MPDDSTPLTPEALATWTDQELLTEWMKLTSHDAKIELFTAEVERRGLDF